MHPMCSKYARNDTVNPHSQADVDASELIPESFNCDALNKQMNSLNKGMNGWMGWIDE